jgi:hypothetical protein
MKKYFWVFIFFTLLAPFVATAENDLTVVPHGEVLTFSFTLTSDNDVKQTLEDSLKTGTLLRVVQTVALAAPEPFAAPLARKKYNWYVGYDLLNNQVSIGTDPAVLVPLEGGFEALWQRLRQFENVPLTPSTPLVRGVDYRLDVLLTFKEAEEKTSGWFGWLPTLEDMWADSTLTHFYIYRAR